MVPFCLHGGDPLSFFKIDEFSKRVRAEFDKGGVFESLIKKYFLENNHKLRLMHIPEPSHSERAERVEKKRLEALTAALSEEDKVSILREAKSLREYQEKPQDQTVLPSLGLGDIQRNIEFVDYETSYLGGSKVKVQWYDQPTNGITYVRVKLNLKSLPERLRVFVPMFVELLPKIGTKNYRYDLFNEKLMNSTNGLDKFSFSEDPTDILDRREQVLIQTGFLERNVD
jgi:Zn-dependent M16 (insulinase) family peptidase